MPILVFTLLPIQKQRNPTHIGFAVTTAIQHRQVLRPQTHWVCGHDHNSHNPLLWKNVANAHVTNAETLKRLMSQPKLWLQTIFKNPTNDNIRE